MSSTDFTWLDLVPAGRLDDLVCQIVIKKLTVNEGNRTHTARDLGVPIRTFQRMLNTFRARGVVIPPSKSGFRWANKCL